MKISRSLNVLLGLFISLSLSLGSPLLLSVTAQPANTQTAQFSDVPANYWAYDYIQKLADSQTISGFPDGKFRPEAPVTRAQFAAVLRQAFAKSPVASSRPFTDVRANYWAADAINAARALGFMVGYPNNRFRPDAPIRRVDAWVALAKGLKYADTAENTLNRYPDARQIPEYAYAAVQSLAKADVIVPDSKDPTKLSPLKSATRADIAAFVYKAMMAASEWQNKPVSVIPAETILSSFSSTGERLAILTSESDKVQVWNTQTGELLSEIVAGEDSQFRAIALSGDGTNIGAITANNTAQTSEFSLWDVQTKARLWQLPAEKSYNRNNYSSPEELSDYYYSVAFRPSDQRVPDQVVVGELPGMLRFYNRSTGAIEQSLPLEYSYRKTAFRQDGAFLAATDGDRVNLLRLQDGELVSSVNLKQVLPLVNDGQFSFYAVDIAFTPDNKLQVLAANPYDGLLNTWDSSQGALSSAFSSVPIGADRGDTSTLLSPDGKYIHMAGSTVGRRLINTQTGDSRWQPDIDKEYALPANGLPYDPYRGTPVFSPNGDYLAIPGLFSDANIYIFSKRKS